MTPAQTKRIAEGGDSIVCESSHSEDGGHAGVIFCKGEGGKKELLGSTDSVFKTADEAKAAMEAVVNGIRFELKKPTAKSKKPTAHVKEKTKDAK